MWIVKNSINLLSSLGHLGVHRATSIQTFDFSTLYNSISHDLLKSRMHYIINNAFKHKNGATRYTHIKVGRNKSYFTSDPLNGYSKYTANDICKMTEFVVDNIYVRFGGQLFRQMVGIPMGTNCAHYWLTCFSIPMKMGIRTKTPLDKTPQTKTPRQKPPLPKTPQTKLMNTKYILHK